MFFTVRLQIGAKKKQANKAQESNKDCNNSHLINKSQKGSNKSNKKESKLNSIHKNQQIVKNIVHDEHSKSKSKSKKKDKKSTNLIQVCIIAYHLYFFLFNYITC